MVSGIWWYLLIFLAFLHGIWWYLVVSANIPAFLCVKHVVRGRPGVFHVKGVQKIPLLGPQNYRKWSFSLLTVLFPFTGSFRMEPEPDEPNWIEPEKG